MHAFLSTVSKARLKSVTFPAILTLCFALASCSGTPIPGLNNSPQCQSNCSLRAAMQGVKIYVEPDDGEQVITNAIADAQKSIWLEIYIL